MNTNTMNRKRLNFTLVLLLLNCMLFAQQKLISTDFVAGSFTLVSSNDTAPVVVDSSDFEGVLLAADNFIKDIERVTSKSSSKRYDVEKNGSIVIGTIGKNSFIDNLIEEGNLDVDSIRNSWEAFTIQQIDGNLIIAGSDKRGTIYGVYTLSEAMGVSPWYWWADVPVAKASELYFTEKMYVNPGPKVQYRGIFINDEAPALSGWAEEKFGGFNHQFYAHVFELILRLKGNYLWPAMWGKSFNDDDPQNPILADKYGIVMGTSHHEPLMRAQSEWKKYGSGEWNFNTNAEKLKEFWKTGIERMGAQESIVTVGMRGDGDEPMTEGTAISLLETIVNEQRKIIASVTQKPAEETPQLWALYKEVQDYYDQGMRVPEDITLLLADDNWGNIRKLPPLDEGNRKGGYGIYYHFDYVGGPRSYKWLNTTQISRVYEQMSLAYAYNAQKIWLVNVGDIKPMEYPTSFFLEYAWDPEAFTLSDLKAYPQKWAACQFGDTCSAEIAELLQTYSTLASRRKPELLDSETYSVDNFEEADSVLKEYANLEDLALALQQKIPETHQAAYYQLVLFPIQALANLNRMYIASAKNKRYAKQGRLSTADYGKQVEEYFEKDKKLTEKYHQLNDSKWNHMMSQTHIGYTYWQQPEENTMPSIASIVVPETGSLGVSTAGSTDFFPEKDALNILAFDKYHSQQTITLFNRGKKQITYNVKNLPEWLSISSKKGALTKDLQLTLQLKKDKIPNAKTAAEFTISQGNSKAILHVVYEPIIVETTGHLEYNGIVSIPATAFTTQTGWELLPDLGLLNSAIRPIHKFSRDINPENTVITYDFTIKEDFEGNLEFLLSPTLDFLNQGGLEFSYSLDHDEIKILNLENDGLQDWDEVLRTNRNRIKTYLRLKAGKHTLNIYGKDPGIVLQHIVLKASSNKQEPYLVPPESLVIEK
ncbi:glycosyl hydrolase 115 family protein [Leeuwenhoekiella sp. MAR_2009_132]|uniref:glycosyl hydrolase 115 family protein n=1 Tax=Leeuwenhoekiella sp. MAR_2009_132 TaxID=1392489 RepID=UPI00048AEB1D|nr:glycosyl hydrolase 115 family protein [Leeuwenhoekiella sp. MAR_2009_132]